MEGKYNRNKISSYNRLFWNECVAFGKEDGVSVVRCEELFGAAAVKGALEPYEDNELVRCYETKEGPAYYVLADGFVSVASYANALDAVRKNNLTEQTEKEPFPWECENEDRDNGEGNREKFVVDLRDLPSFMDGITLSDVWAVLGHLVSIMSEKGIFEEK